MNVLRFQARDSAQAIRQIQAQLGAEAVVLSVNRLPAKGLGRLWRRPGLEVLAGVPEEEEMEGRESLLTSAPTADASADWGSGREQILSGGGGQANGEQSRLTSAATGGWRSAAVLEQMGLMPLCIDRVLERARQGCADTAPSSFGEEFSLVREALESFWQKPSAGRAQHLPPLHVFVGAPGSGKTTALCKWLAKAVLVENRAVRAWRLDSRSANFAGLLDFYSEILGVPLEREWRELPATPGFELGFVDLPGVGPQDAAGLQQLESRVRSFPGAQVHLVLNAAYEVPALLSQVRAYAALPLSDLIITHLDEEKRRGKLWNLVLGTNLPVRFLAGGQNIPGEFSPASPELLYAR